MVEYITEKIADYERGEPLIMPWVRPRWEISVGIDRYVPGLSTANPENPDMPREREAYLRNVLAPMIERGEVGDGVKSKWDDRKFRFDGADHFYSKDRLDEVVARLGITHYKECAAGRKRTSEEIVRLEEEGRRRFNDSTAFFTRGCGIAATPITAEGSIFIGPRKVVEEASGYAGELAAVNGWVNYKENLEDVDFREDVFREMKQEYGIERENVRKLIFAGVFSAPNMADTDFAYLAQTTLPDSFFAEGYYKKKREEKEHGELIKIANYKDMRCLLETGKLPGYKGRLRELNLLYSLRASLEQIRPGEMAD